MKRRTTFEKGMSLADLRKDQTPEMQERFWREVKRIDRQGSSWDSKELFVKRAMSMGVAQDIMDELRRWYGLGPDDSEEGARLDGKEATSSIAFTKVCAAACRGYQPTIEQWPLFVETAKRMGLFDEIRPIMEEWGIDLETGEASRSHPSRQKNTDFEFVSRLLERVGKHKFIQLVCSARCTTRDAQNLLGALRRGIDYFIKYADKRVIKILGDYELAK